MQQLQCNDQRRVDPDVLPAQLLNKIEHWQGIKTVDRHEFTLLSVLYPCDLLNGVGQGPEYFQRIGNSIDLHAVHIAGMLVPTGLGTGRDNYIRLVVFYDTAQNNQATSAPIYDVLADIDETGGHTSSYESYQNVDNTPRFKILKDLRLPIPDDGNGVATVDNMAIVDYSRSTHINWFIPLEGLRTCYSGSSNPPEPSDISTGSLWLLMCAGSLPSAGAYMLNWTARLFYSDTQREL